MGLNERIQLIQSLFDKMHGQNASSWQVHIVAQFRKDHPELNEDLDFCFEVLAGKHKVGYTVYTTKDPIGLIEFYEPTTTIKEYYINYKTTNFTDEYIFDICDGTPREWQDFFVKLINREYKLGYSNRHAMISELSPMLAKKYPESHREQFYYIQEKLDGNRCIAYFEDGEWKFRSRSGKPLNVNFDMNWADINLIFDGEIMTLGKAGSRDFNRTSGAINSKYGNKSDLHYYIYDIVDSTLTYQERFELIMLQKRNTGTDVSGYDLSRNVSLLPILDKVWVYPNPAYNHTLDHYLDMIVSKGGEGIMLRDPDGYYENGKRSNYLLKYKKTKTMDLRIVGWNEGKGKYEGAIGSFICESDDGSIKVNVAGIADNIRFDDPNMYIGHIVEIAYFDESTSKTKNTTSLRFPRIIRFREDKNETSTY